MPSRVPPAIAALVNLADAEEVRRTGVKGAGATALYLDVVKDPSELTYRFGALPSAFGGGYIVCHVLLVEFSDEGGITAVWELVWERGAISDEDGVDHYDAEDVEWDEPIDDPYDWDASDIVVPWSESAWLDYMAREAWDWLEAYGAYEGDDKSIAEQVALAAAYREWAQQFEPSERPCVPSEGQCG